jgi:hypothetical protein
MRSTFRPDRALLIATGLGAAWERGVGPSAPALGVAPRSSDAR